MGALPDLPAELISLIVDYLRDDREALKACTLVSRAFVALSQARLFERVALQSPSVLSYFDCERPDVRGCTHFMQTHISSDPDGILSYTRSLSIDLAMGATRPQDLEEIYDHWMAFKNIRKLQAPLLATDFVKDPMSLSRCFSHFQPTLRCLHLNTSLESPKNLITFIAFFPLLEEVSIETLHLASPTILYPDESRRFDPDLLPPLRGSLLLRWCEYENSFLMELAKVRVQYHTLTISDATVWKGLQEFITACAPTLQVLNIVHEDHVCGSYPDIHVNLTACTRLTEINLDFLLQELSSDVYRCSTLLSNISISSPHLRKITFTGISNITTITDMLSHEAWRTLEDSLLEVSSRNRNALEVVIILSFPASGTLDHPAFLPRFREVGRVIFESPVPHCD